MTTNPNESVPQVPASPPASDQAGKTAGGALPPGYEEFADEILVANGPMPNWFRWLPHALLIFCLAYYVYVRAFDPVNLVFAALFITWMIYTPIAQKRGWFFIPM